jgi:ferredoxin
MITITLQRDKCIGCNYCREHAPQRWAMSGKDGRAILIGSHERKGFHSLKVHEIEEESNRLAASACPVHIIKISSN